MRRVHWFKTLWPTKWRRRRVLEGYEALQEFPETLTDIALRGGVMNAAPPANADMALFERGRHSLACEILDLAQADLNALYAQTEKLGQPKKGDDDA